MMPGAAGDGGEFARAITAALAGSPFQPLVCFAAAGVAAEEMVARIRSGMPEACVLLVIEPGVAALSRAMLTAAIGPLAIELAPGTRVAALDIAPGARPDDAAAGAVFLASAGSTTGQIIAVAALA